MKFCLPFRFYMTVQILFVLPFLNYDLLLARAQTAAKRNLPHATVYFLTRIRERIPLQVLVIDKIEIRHLRNLTLALSTASAKNFNIRLLIGVDHYWDIIEDRVIRGQGPRDIFSLDNFKRLLHLPTPLTKFLYFNTFRFKTILFGSTCSLFLLKTILRCYLQNYDQPVTHDIKNNIYVDNVISGCDNETDSVQYYRCQHSVSKMEFINRHPELYTCKKYTPLPTIAKRHELQISSKICDPLGLLSPSLAVKVKKLIKELWRKELKWDEPLPLELKTKWQNIATYKKQLTILFKENIIAKPPHRIPRRTSIYLTMQVLRLMDACSLPYQRKLILAYHGQVWSCNSKGINFSALIGTRLAKFLSDAVTSRYLNLKIKFWSDSEIVLRAVTRALIGGGGHVHVFVLCPTNFF